MQGPVSVAKLGNTTSVEYAWFERSSALIDYSTLVIFGANVLNTVLPGGLGGDPVLQIPDSLRSTHTACKIIVGVRPGASISNGTYSPFVSTQCSFLGQIGSNGLYIDGALSQFSMTGDKGEYFINQVPSSLDFSSMAFVNQMDSSYNVATFNAVGGNVHRLTAIFKISLLLYGTN